MFVRHQAHTYVLETHKLVPSLPKVEFITEFAVTTVMKVSSTQQLASLMNQNMKIPPVLNAPSCIY